MSHPDGSYDHIASDKSLLTLPPSRIASMAALGNQRLGRSHVITQRAAGNCRRCGRLTGGKGSGGAGGARRGITEHSADARACCFAEPGRHGGKRRYPRAWRSGSRTMAVDCLTTRSRSLNRLVTTQVVANPDGDFVIGCRSTLIDLSGRRADQSPGPVALAAGPAGFSVRSVRHCYATRTARSRSSTMGIR